MFNFYRKSGIIIPKKYESENFYFQIKEYLKRRIQNYNTPDYRICYFYLENDKALLIPRFFPLDKFIQNYKIKNLIPNGKSIQIEHNIIPRNKVQKRAIKYLYEHKNGILQLPPGVGKTVIMIYHIANLKKKSFILVHRDSLVEQWKKRILQFTNLNEYNISKLSSKTFEEDLNKSIIISTSQTFISLLKRQRLKFLENLSLANIGIFVPDEIHTTIGAPTFSECSIHIPAKYTYGLSATPYRHDGNGDIINFHLGEIFEDDDSDGTMKAKVTLIMLDYQIDTYHRHKYLYWAGSFQRSRYLNIMKNSKIFMNVIKSLLNKFKKNRKSLIIGERIPKLIDILYDWVDCNSKGKFVGNANLDILKNKLIFATPGKIRDGIDIPEIDCLVMTSPISNINQMSGRVTRTYLNKKQPIIIDMVDIGCKRIKNTVWNRIEFYKEKNWGIQYVLYVDNKPVIIHNEEEAIKIIKGD